MHPGFTRIDDLPKVIPVFPLDGAILLPGGALPLNIFEPRYLNMVDDALAGERLIGMIQTAGGSATRPALAGVGCVGKITAFSETGDGRYLITLTGVARFSVERELLVHTPYRQVMPDYSAFENDLGAIGDDDDDGFDRVPFLDALRVYLEARGMEIDWTTAGEAPCEALVNSLAMALPFDTAEKQALLEAADAAERRSALITLLQIDAAAPSDDDEPPSVQ
jgi:Lon protease-like protein